MQLECWRGVGKENFTFIARKGINYTSAAAVERERERQM